MKIYGDFKSGNCYKLKLICALLDIDYDWIPINILEGDTRSESFRILNPNGQIPVCVTDDGSVITESNAILYFLACDSQYWPAGKLAQTRTLEWQFFEQYSHEPSIAVARFISFYQDMPDDRKDEYQEKLKAGYRALDLMEKHLEINRFMVGDDCTIADISLFAYTHVAHEGGFELTNYPAIRAWLGLIEGLERFVSMND